MFKFIAALAAKRQKVAGEGLREYQSLIARAVGQDDLGPAELTRLEHLHSLHGGGRSLEDVARDVADFPVMKKHVDSLPSLMREADNLHRRLDAHAEATNALYAKAKERFESVAEDLAKACADAQTKVRRARKDVLAADVAHPGRSAIVERLEAAEAELRDCDRRATQHSLNGADADGQIDARRQAENSMREELQAARKRVRKAVEARQRLEEIMLRSWSALGLDDPGPAIAAAKALREEAEKNEGRKAHLVLADFGHRDRNGHPAIPGTEGVRVFDIFELAERGDRARILSELDFIPGPGQDSDEVEGWITALRSGLPIRFLVSTRGRYEPGVPRRSEYKIEVEGVRGYGFDADAVALIPYPGQSRRELAGFVEELRTERSKRKIAFAGD